MKADEIKDIIRCGETSTVQFKLMFKTAEDIANEIVGLEYAQIQVIGSLVASAADDRVHPAVFPIVETALVDGKAIMIISITKGADAPYTNNKGEIYVKQGPDKTPSNRS